MIKLNKFAGALNTLRECDLTSWPEALKHDYRVFNQDKLANNYTAAELMLRLWYSGFSKDCDLNLPVSFFRVFQL